MVKFGMGLLFVIRTLGNDIDVLYYFMPMQAVLRRSHYCGSQEV